MVKYANKPKGRPSKRKTFKVKYKIEKKVKQHQKRMKKEARKLRGTGLKHKGIARSDYLPNMFPFKQQFLDEARKLLPKTQEAQVKNLNQTQFGLINLENKCSYLPKPKDNLIKKYVTNLQYALSNVQIVLELLDSKNPEVCIDKEFRQQCAKSGVVIISVLTKADTVTKDHLEHSQTFSKQHCQKLVTFSTDHKRRQKSINDLKDALDSIKGGLILVAGKALTGKHSFISAVARAAGCYQQSPYQLQAFKLWGDFSLVDSPYKIIDKSGHPSFMVPNPILEESIIAQEEKLIRKLFVGQNSEKPVFERDQVIVHFSIQDFLTVSDFVAKVGRVGKHFGKGGSIDVSRVRNRIITDWFTGKLNSLLKSK